MEKAVIVKNLSKKYSIGSHERYLTIRDMAIKAAKVPINLLKGKKFRKKGEFWALKDVNFEVNVGEVVGIIGRNGAGKSTLFSLITGDKEPEDGKINLAQRTTIALSRQVIPRDELDLTVREFFQKCFKDKVYGKGIKR